MAKENCGKKNATHQKLLRDIEYEKALSKRIEIRKKTSSRNETENKTKQEGKEYDTFLLLLLLFEIISILVHFYLSDPIMICALYTVYIHKDCLKTLHFSPVFSLLIRLRCSPLAFPSRYLPICVHLVQQFNFTNEIYKYIHI